MQVKTPSDVFLARFPEKAVHSNHQGENGRTQVVCLDPRAISRGDSSTPNIQPWRRDGSVSSLWRVLQEDPIPEKFYLKTARATKLADRLRGSSSQNLKPQAATLLAALTKGPTR